MANCQAKKDGTVNSVFTRLTAILLLASQVLREPERRLREVQTQTRRRFHSCRTLEQPQRKKNLFFSSFQSFLYDAIDNVRKRRGNEAWLAENKKIARKDLLVAKTLFHCVKPSYRCPLKSNNGHLEDKCYARYRTRLFFFIISCSMIITFAS